MCDDVMLLLVKRRQTYLFLVFKASVAPMNVMKIIQR